MTTVGLLPALTLVARGFVQEGICPDGRYVMQLRGQPRAVVIDAGALSIEGLCPPTTMTLGTSERGTTVRAEWTSCTGRLRGRVRVRAVIDRTCTAMKGRLRRFRAGTARPFAAGRIPVCGNGVLEEFESCDDHNTADGDCCTSFCHRGYAPGCDDRCLTDAECGAGAYCARGFDECGGEGTCHTYPLACTDERDPACGCDLELYANRCHAAAAGVALLDLEHCAGTCGTIVGIPCPDGHFCEFPPDSCNAADLGGSCVVVPEACTLDYRPVCGCDGVTYGNDCARRGARAQLAHVGRCAAR